MRVTIVGDIVSVSAVNSSIEIVINDGKERTAITSDDVLVKVGERVKIVGTLDENTGKIVDARIKSLTFVRHKVLPPVPHLTEWLTARCYIPTRSAQPDWILFDIGLSDRLRNAESLTSVLLKDFNSFCIVSRWPTTIPLHFNAHMKRIGFKYNARHKDCKGGFVVYVANPKRPVEIKP